MSYYVPPELQYQLHRPAPQPVMDPYALGAGGVPEFWKIAGFKSATDYYNYYYGGYGLLPPEPSAEKLEEPVVVSVPKEVLGTIVEDVTGRVVLRGKYGGYGMLPPEPSMPREVSVPREIIGTLEPAGKTVTRPVTSIPEYVLTFMPTQYGGKPVPKAGEPAWLVAERKADVEKAFQPFGTEAARLEREAKASFEAQLAQAKWQARRDFEAQLAQAKQTWLAGVPKIAEREWSQVKDQTWEKPERQKFEASMRQWETEQRTSFEAQLSVWKVQTREEMLTRKRAYEVAWQPKGIAERMLDLAAIEPQAIFQKQKEMVSMFPISAAEKAQFARAYPFQQIFPVQISPAPAIRFAAGVIAAPESFVYSIGSLLGVKTPRVPATVTGSLISSGIESIKKGQVTVSTELESLQQVGPEYALGTVVGDILMAYGLGKAVSWAAKPVKPYLGKIKESIVTKAMEKGIHLKMPSLHDWLVTRTDIPKYAWKVKKYVRYEDPWTSQIYSDLQKIQTGLYRRFSPKAAVEAQLTWGTSITPFGQAARLDLSGFEFWAQILEAPRNVGYPILWGKMWLYATPRETPSWLTRGPERYVVRPADVPAVGGTEEQIMRRALGAGYHPSAFPSELGKAGVRTEEEIMRRALGGRLPISEVAEKAKESAVKGAMYQAVLQVQKDAIRSASQTVGKIVQTSAVMSAPKGMQVAGGLMSLLAGKVVPVERLKPEVGHPAFAFEMEKLKFRALEIETLEQQVKPLARTLGMQRQGLLQRTVLGLEHELKPHVVSDVGLKVAPAQISVPSLKMVIGQIPVIQPVSVTPQVTRPTVALKPPALTMGALPSYIMGGLDRRLVPARRPYGPRGKLKRAAYLYPVMGESELAKHLFGRRK